MSDEWSDFDESRINDYGRSPYYYDDGCDYSRAVYGIVAGVLVFLVLIIYLLYWLRFRRMSRWKTRSFDFRTGKGRTEIVVAVYMTFLSLVVILEFANLGLTLNTCNTERYLNEVNDNGKVTPKFYKEVNKSIQNMKHRRNLGWAALAFAALALWCARLATSLAIGVFHRGLTAFAKVTYYAQSAIVLLMIIFSGIVIPAVFSHSRYSLLDGIYEERRVAVHAMLWIYMVFDFLFLATTMILTWNVNTFLEVKNMAYHERRAASQWTLSIISIFAPVVGFIALGVERSWGGSFLLTIWLLCHFIEAYFALIMGLLPGFRFWIEAWKLPLNKVEVVAPVETTKTIDPAQASPTRGTAPAPEMSQTQTGSAGPSNTQHSAYAQSAGAAV